MDFHPPPIAAYSGAHLVLDVNAFPEVFAPSAPAPGLASGAQTEVEDAGAMRLASFSCGLQWGGDVIGWVDAGLDGLGPGDPDPSSCGAAELSSCWWWCDHTVSCQ